MKLDYTLRKVTMEDLDFIYSIKKITLKKYIGKIWGWDEKYQQDDLRKNFIMENNKIIVLKGKDIGILETNENKDEIYIVELGVHPDFQGYGIGTSIIESIVKSAIERGKKTKLGVFKINSRAKKLYERIGFRLLKESDTHFIMEKE